MMDTQAIAKMVRHATFRVRSAAIRASLKICGILLLIGGSLWSIAALDLRPDQLSPWPLLINLCLLTPLSLFCAALSLRITAQAMGLTIGLGRASVVTATAYVAELLPVPGGALVRGHALVTAGASLAASARMVTLTAVLTLSMTVAISALALTSFGLSYGLIISVIAGLAALGALGLVGRETSVGMLMAMVAVRLVALFISILRLAASFAALGLPHDWAEVILYIAATTLGSTVGIIPGGFGINEAIAASMAVLIDAPPAEAFLAVALNHALALLGAAAVFAGHRRLGHS